MSDVDILVHEKSLVKLALAKTMSTDCIADDRLVYRPLYPNESMLPF